jgi:predicted nuclease of predicted toxin-antitoxin system
MALLYADENFDLPVVAHMRSMGHDVLTAHQAGQSNQQILDAQVLAFAAAQDLAVLTFDRWHFLRLHQRILLGGGSHNGIIVCTKDDDVAALALRIHQAIAALPSLANQLMNIRKPPSPPPPGVP